MTRWFAVLVFFLLAICSCDSFGRRTSKSCSTPNPKYSRDGAQRDRSCPASHPVCALSEYHDYKQYLCSTCLSDRECGGGGSTCSDGQCSKPTTLTLDQVLTFMEENPLHVVILVTASSIIGFLLFVLMIYCCCCRGRAVQTAPVVQHCEWSALDAQQRGEKYTVPKSGGGICGSLCFIAVVVVLGAILVSAAPQILLGVPMNIYLSKEFQDCTSGRIMTYKECVTLAMAVDNLLHGKK